MTKKTWIEEGGGEGAREGPGKLAHLEKDVLL